MRWSFLSSLVAACNGVFSAATLVHDFYIGQPKGRQILDYDVALVIESKITLGGIIGTRLDFNIRVGIGEIVFWNFLVIFASCKLFLKHKLVYFIGGKFKDFFLFAFFFIVSSLLFYFLFDSFLSKYHWDSKTDGRCQRSR